MYTPKYFTLAELAKSSTAIKYKLDNTPSELVKQKLLLLIENTLDPVRTMWGKPITVTSGYRSPLVNAKAGGAKASSHLTGEAADIQVGGGRKEEVWKLYTMIKRSRIPYSKMIFEVNKRGSYWVHISYVANSVTRLPMIYDIRTGKYNIDRT